MRGRILWLIAGVLVVVGVVWLIPWLALSSANVEAPQVQGSKDQPEQEIAQDQPEQETAKEQPKDEEAPKDAPLKEEGASNNLPSTSPPTQSSSLPSAPPSPPTQSSSLPPAPPYPPKVEEAPKSVPSLNSYWDYEPDPYVDSTTYFAFTVWRRR